MHRTEPLYPVRTTALCGVEVINERGVRVSLNALKNRDLLIIYWEKPKAWSITKQVQGVDYHVSLCEFDSIDGRCLRGRCYDRYGFFSFDDVKKIQIAGHDTTGRTMLFVEQLFDQNKELRDKVQKMTQSIDSLKT